MASGMITHVISGELYDELHDGTALDSGKSETATWGYGDTREVDIEVYTMVHAAVGVRRGFGQSFTLTGSREAWRAIREYAADRAYMEQHMSGDMNASMGRRLDAQADKIGAMLAQHETETHA